MTIIQLMLISIIKFGLYDFKIDQELGRNGEFNLNYNWTSDREALRELTKINDDIVDRDELDPRKTDVDLYKSVKYINGNNDVSVGVDNEELWILIQDMWET